MSISLVQMAVLKAVGLFFVTGCIITAIPAYHFLAMRSSTSVGPSKVRKPFSAKFLLVALKYVSKSGLKLIVHRLSKNCASVIF